MIREITTDDLRRMENKEGLILQDCGGDLQEWQDGINDLLTKENILLNGSKFENCFSFEHKGIFELENQCFFLLHTSLLLVGVVQELPAQIPDWGMIFIYSKEVCH